MINQLVFPACQAGLPTVASSHNLLCAMPKEQNTK